MGKKKIPTGPVTFDVDGETYALPLFTLTSGEMRRIRKMNNLDALYTLLEERADKKTIAATDKLGFIEASKLFGRWMQGLRLGESSGSSS
jgi:hypothetical protein